VWWPAGGATICNPRCLRLVHEIATGAAYDDPKRAASARVRLIVWCKACQHQVEPDPAEMAERYGADTAVLDWRQE
jgi:hypothetical protein